MRDVRVELGGSGRTGGIRVTRGRGRAPGERGIRPGPSGGTRPAERGAGGEPAVAAADPGAARRRRRVPARPARRGRRHRTQAQRRASRTSRRRCRRFRRRPSSRTHLTQLDDIGSLVTNLNIFEAHDNSPAVVMRGVGSFELVQGVGFYMNDVQLFEGQTVRPMDIERIEVLKGPQGTLYGGANIGGAIKYVTKDPTPTWQNEVTAEVGNYRQANVSAVISGPIADKLGMRVSLYERQQRGYIWDTYQNKTIGADPRSRRAPGVSRRAREHDQRAVFVQRRRLRLAEPEPAVQGQPSSTPRCCRTRRTTIAIRWTTSSTRRSPARPKRRPWPSTTSSTTA